jgi:hypothetical protein
MIKKSYIKKVQEKIVRLLRLGSHRKPLYLLTRDNTYEVTKLLGYWIIEKFSEARAYLIRGKITPTTFHVVLLIEEDEKYWILDIAIWKFFKFKRSILVGKAEGEQDALKIITKQYGGKWQVAEKLSRNHIKSHEVELLTLIKKMAQ